jgi:hypothetical protein
MTKDGSEFLGLLQFVFGPIAIRETPNWTMMDMQAKRKTHECIGRVAC